MFIKVTDMDNIDIDEIDASVTAIVAAGSTAALFGNPR
jgi:hypothetical protein